jgi:hypothetical protein
MESDINRADVFFPDDKTNQVNIKYRAMRAKKAFFAHSRRPDSYVYRRSDCRVVCLVSALKDDDRKEGRE